MPTDADDEAPKDEDDEKAERNEETDEAKAERKEEVEAAAEAEDTDDEVLVVNVVHSEHDSAKANGESTTSALPDEPKPVDEPPAEDEPTAATSDKVVSSPNYVCWIATTTWPNYPRISVISKTKSKRRENAGFSTALLAQADGEERQFEEARAAGVSSGP